MENNRKDPRRQLIGAVSKALGQQFERDINAAFDHYRRLGVASIEKTPEPFHMTGRENGGKVRAMMAGGNWGDGAPEPTVWQARLLSRSRAEMQTTMTMLVEALNCRIRQVGYDPALEDHWNQYWQRTTCLHWDDLKHCTAGCTDCDSCAEYKKIPPQYCARCGATFYERKENTFCLQCRFDRKKQAQRHWCRVNAKRGERP